MPSFIPWPIRNEADAFRWVLVFAAVAISIIVLDVIVGDGVAFIWALVVGAAGITLLARTWRNARNIQRRRVMIITDGPLDPGHMSSALAGEWADEPTEALIISAATHDGSAIAAERARQEMELSLQAVREAGAKAEGRVTEGDPGRIYADAIASFEPAELVVAEPLQGAGANPLEGTEIEHELPIRRIPLAGPHLP